MVWVNKIAGTETSKTTTVRARWWAMALGKEKGSTMFCFCTIMDRNTGAMPGMFRGGTLFDVYRLHKRLPEIKSTLP